MQTILEIIKETEQGVTEILFRQDFLLWQSPHKSHVMGNSVELYGWTI